MLVICCGLRRSASTLQYHIARDIVLANDGHDFGWVIHLDKLVGAYRALPAPRLAVCKMHQYPFPHYASFRRLAAEGQVRPVYIFRDPRDVSASLKRFAPIKYKREAALDLAAMSKEHASWSAHAGIYMSRYDDVVNNIGEEALNIAEYLGVDLSHDSAKRIAVRFSLENQRARLPKKKWDGKLIMWPNHIHTGETGIWKGVLTPDEVSMTLQHMSNVFRDYYAKG